MAKPEKRQHLTHKTKDQRTDKKQDKQKSNKKTQHYTENDNQYRPTTTCVKACARQW